MGICVKCFFNIYISLVTHAVYSKWVIRNPSCGLLYDNQIMLYFLLQHSFIFLLHSSSTAWFTAVELVVQMRENMIQMMSDEGGKNELLPMFPFFFFFCRMLPCSSSGSDWFTPPVDQSVSDIFLNTY